MRSFLEFITQEKNEQVAAFKFIPEGILWSMREKNLKPLINEYLITFGMKWQLCFFDVSFALQLIVFLEFFLNSKTKIIKKNISWQT